MDLTGIAASGMQAAEARLNVAAENIAGSDLQAQADPNSQAPASDSQAKPLQALQLVQFSQADGGVGVQVLGQGAEDLPLSMIGLTLALNQFKANVKVFETADQETKTLLDLKA
jgi:flagellar hook protein FlgE